MLRRKGEVLVLVRGMECHRAVLDAVLLLMPSSDSCSTGSSVARPCDRPNEGRFFRAVMSGCVQQLGCEGEGGEGRGDVRGQTSLRAAPPWCTLSSSHDACCRELEGVSARERVEM